MSKYTTEVRFICENYAGYDVSQGYDKVEDILDKSWQKVFDFEFPIFDEEYKPVLCKKILKHYYTREIGFETVGLWKLKLNMLMNEMMPYYNQLYNSTLLEWNPLYDADYTKSHEGSDEGEGTDRNTGTVTDAGTHGGTVGDSGTHTGTIGDVGRNVLAELSWDKYSDTPQGAITNLANDSYLTNARNVTHSSQEDTNNTRTFNEANGNTRTFNETNGNLRTDNLTMTREYNNTDEYLEHVQGKFPGRSYASLIKEFRETFLNIDMDVIADLSDLFIKLW